jgi:hypothetical protein
MVPVIACTFLYFNDISLILPVLSTILFDINNPRIVGIFEMTKVYLKIKLLITNMPNTK